MTHDIAQTPVTVESARQRSSRAEAIKEAWRVGQPPDAAAAIREDPDLAADRAAALDLAYEEFCAREEAGEALDSSAFCARFTFGTSLRRLLTVHRFLDDHPDALAEVPASWPNAGDRVGDVLVVRELGRGGFSRVYLGVETTAGDRPVALKVAAAGSREAQTLGPLSHPHLIPVLSSRLAGAWTAVAMPFVGSATLEDLITVAWKSDRTGPPRSAGAILDAAAQGRREDDPPFSSEPRFPIDAGMTYDAGVSAVASGLFDALTYLHGKGIAHRDLKPSNVLLGPTGHPYLLDFNLATRHSDQWGLAGTLPYMAPEQLALLADSHTAPPADWRPADVFACGVILFELLAGRHPFAAPEVLAGLPNRDAPAAALLEMQRAGRAKLAGLNPRVKRAVRNAVERCLAVDPNDRPTAAELAAAFAPAEEKRSRRGLVLIPLVLAATGAVAALWFGDLSPRRAVASDAPPSSEPPAPAGPFERGVQLSRKGEHALAAVEFQAAGSAGRGGRAFACAAYCRSLGKDSAGAAELADEAIRLGYATAPVYANRAFNHLQAGRHRDALADCDEALRLDPELRAARYTRAFVHLQLHHRTGVPIPAEAVADVERVIADGPNAADVWTTAAELFVLAPGGTAGREKAVRAVRGAIAAGKSPAVIRRNPVLKKALAGDPNYETALTATPGPADASVHPHLVNPIP